MPVEPNPFSFLTDFGSESADWTISNLTSNFSKKTTCAILCPTFTENFSSEWLNKSTFTIPRYPESASAVILWFKHSPDLEKILPKKPLGIAILKSSETIAFDPGEISLSSAAYRSYLAASGVVWYGTLQSSDSGYMVV